MYPACVPEELIAAHEAFWALYTLPRLLVDVCLLVLAEVGRILEFLVTFLACVTPIVAVRVLLMDLYDF